MALRAIGEFVSSTFAQRQRQRPTLIGLQGPQGSGKSYLTGKLAEHCLREHSLRVEVLSIDDFYLPHSDLALLAAAHKGNALLGGRGLPGTHDLALLTGVLNALNTGEEDEIMIPVYDKSAYGGRGDRSSEVRRIRRTATDVIVLEGWCVGFTACADSDLDQVYNATAYARSFCSLKDVGECNTFMKQYEPIWKRLTSLIQLTPPLPSANAFDIICRWRIEQEHGLKPGGMSDEEVVAFVRRYMPGYIFFERGLRDAFRGRGLAIHLDEHRQLVDQSVF